MAKDTLKRLSWDMIALALTDFRIKIPKRPNRVKEKQCVYRNLLLQTKEYYEDAKKWIEAKSRKPLGFYFCLQYSEKNPNCIRKYINKCIKHNDKALQHLNELLLKESLR